MSFGLVGAGKYIKTDARNAQQIEQLTLILMDALHVHIEKRLGWQGDMIALLDYLVELTFILPPHVLPFFAER